MIFWAINESIGVGILKATDMGGSMFVHAFGAYFGVAASFFF
jgi:ammonium transporter Rh